MFFDFRCLSNFTSLLTLMSSDPKRSLRFVFSICLVKMVYIVFHALRSILYLSHHLSKCLIPICKCLVAISCFSCVYYNAMSSAYCETDVSLHFGLLTYILDRIVLIMLPWGTPASCVKLLELAWLFFTFIFLLLRKLLVHFVIHHGVLISICLYKIPSCHTE